MTAIEFENISKQYQLGNIGTGTLSRDLNRWWARIRGKEDPYLKIGQVNNRASKAEGDFVWALRDINFKVEQGVVLGIIGKNGSGKSTLLKILSKVTSPTTGHIRGRGRVASLLEVGTGFHPEMTGRENIYMNGSIMGMTKAEIDRKLDEIVDFAGVQMYVDTPVKRYSSGMTVRLGFAIAAHLEPEILVVDEVLAVGDAEFQKKAIGKMQDVAKGEGRTVLFVSHNMAAVRNLCSNGIVLKNGMLEYMGTADDCVDRYTAESQSNIVTKTLIKEEHHYPGFMHDLEFMEVEMFGDAHNMATDDEIELLITMRCNNHSVKQCNYTFYVNDSSNQRILQFISQPTKVPNDADIYKIKLKITDHCLACGLYYITLEVGQKDLATAVLNYDHVSNVLSFNINRLHSNPSIGYAVWNRSWGGFYIDEGKKITTELL